MVVLLISKPDETSTAADRFQSMDFEGVTPYT